MRHILLPLILALFTLSAVAQQTTDTPRRGEGISSFLQRNHRSGQAYYREFLRLNEKKLKGKKELILGVRYVLPPLKEGGEQSVTAKKRQIKEPLFGKKLSHVDVTGSSLDGACFYIVSGHGGPDPGAIGRLNGHELHEDEYAYDVALRLARNLMQEGAEVHIIIQDKKDGIRNDNYLKNSKRETCMGDPIPLNQVERLKQRCVKINELYRKDRQKYKYCKYSADRKSDFTYGIVTFLYSVDAICLIKQMKCDIAVKVPAVIIHKPVGILCIGHVEEPE